MNTSYLPSVLRVLILCLVATVAARAEDNAVHLTDDQKKALASTLQWQTGTITLKSGFAKIALTNGFRYLGSDDARKVLHQLWENPDDPDVIGMIFPKESDNSDSGDYAVTVHYEDEGYVKDDDADKLKYDDILKQMQQSQLDANPERVKEGYDPMELLNWAQPPRYDKATHKLYWAMEYKVGQDPKHTLNYEIRILGRHGALVLTVLGGMDQLSQVNNDIPQILAMVDFQPGNTYAEFDPKIDKIAEYGLTGLIAGGALATAAKLGLFAGLFKWILAAIIALKKLAIVIVVAIVAGVKKVWGMITGRRKTPDNLLPPGQK